MSSFREATAANLMPEGEGIMSNTDDRICKKDEKLNEEEKNKTNHAKKHKHYKMINSKNIISKDIRSSHKLPPFYLHIGYGGSPGSRKQPLLLFKHIAR